MPSLLRSLLATIVGAAGLIAASPAPGPLPQRPNILLIVTDDQGYGDASGFAPTDVETPTLDRIARAGVRFTQFRVNPLCAPTRASLLTGLDSLATGMWRGPSEPGRAEARGKAKATAKVGRRPATEDPEDSTPDRGEPRRIRAGIRLLPELLREAGYATGLFGKWHLGYAPEESPNARGFDEFVGFLGGAHPYWLRANSRLQENGGPLAAEGHTTDVFADRAARFIRRQRDQPFFCYVAFNAVHGPLRSKEREADSALPRWLEHYAGRGLSPERRDYNAVLSHADQRIGGLLDLLGELGLTERTLVICHSDNGGITHTYPANNGPLRGGKGQTFEGGIRVPAVAQWPGVIPAGWTSRADAAHYDLFATMLAAAGLTVPARNGSHVVQGIDLLPHLRSGGQAALPERYQFWDLYGQCGALRGPWKLVGTIDNHHGRFGLAADAAERTPFVLFNLEQDLGETRDLSAEQPVIYADLKARHVAWLRQYAETPRAR